MYTIYTQLPAIGHWSWYIQLHLWDGLDWWYLRYQHQWMLSHFSVRTRQLHWLYTYRTNRLRPNKSELCLLSKRLHMWMPCGLLWQRLWSRCWCLWVDALSERRHVCGCGGWSRIHVRLPLWVHRLGLWDWRRRVCLDLWPLSQWRNLHSESEWEIQRCINMYTTTRPSITN